MSVYEKIYASICVATVVFGFWAIDPTNAFSGQEVGSGSNAVNDPASGKKNAQSKGVGHGPGWDDKGGSANQGGTFKYNGGNYGDNANGKGAGNGNAAKNGGYDK